MKKSQTKPKIIVILGPTASGKSALAVNLARRFNGEVISADSRQVYRSMDVGTGKITKKEMHSIPHHLLDITSPKRHFTVAQYKKLGQKAIKKILMRNKIPIICGGTGFYIDVLAENIPVPEIKPDLKLRAKLEKIDTAKLYELLQKNDPRRAQTIDRFNRRRLVRAIEIYEKSGQPVPKQKASPLYNALFLGIKKSPDELKKLIATRLKKRLRQGMIAEVKKLNCAGVSWKKLDDFGLEYRWIARFLQKKISRQEMFLRLQKDIEHYAKRQMTWFNRNQKIFWIKNKSEALRLSEKFIF